MTVDLLQDIYDVHRAFQYQHYHMMDYKPEDFIKDMKQNMYLEQPGIYKRFNFNPEWLLNDNMLDVVKYIYGVSLYINKIKNSFKA